MSFLNWVPRYLGIYLNLETPKYLRIWSRSSLTANAAPERSGIQAESSPASRPPSSAGICHDPRQSRGLGNARNLELTKPTDTEGPPIGRQNSALNAQKGTGRADEEPAGLLIVRRRRERTVYKRCSFHRSASATHGNMTVPRALARALPRTTLRPAPRSARSSVRLLSTTVRRRTSLPPVSPPLTTALPSDSFQLLPESQKAGAAEDALYEQQIEAVETWWRTPRFHGISRPYTAADVVSKRGSQQQSYPSSTMARKLWDLIREREARGEPLHTSESRAVAGGRRRDAC